MSIEKFTATEFINDKQQYYVADPKAIDAISDCRNPDALAIWTYLTNKPNNWKVVPEQLKSQFNLGRDRYSAAIKVLKKCGVFKTASLKKDGQFAGSVTLVTNKLGKYSDEQSIQVSVGSDGAPSIQVSEVSVDRIHGGPSQRSTDTALTNTGVLTKSGNSSIPEKPNKAGAGLPTPPQRYGEPGDEADKTLAPFFQQYSTAGKSYNRNQSLSAYRQHVEGKYLPVDFSSRLQNYIDGRGTQNWSRIEKLIREEEWQNYTHTPPQPNQHKSPVIADMSGFEAKQ